MIGPFEKLQRAESRLKVAQSCLAAAKKETFELLTKFREALPVSVDVPCAVAILPTGDAVVHVWVEASSERNQLHIVKAGLYDQDAQPRKAFPGEQFGQEKLNRD